MSEDQVVVGSPERDIHVTALVHLERIEAEQQEENETDLYKMRAKLYRYHIDSEDGAMWKERGIGEVKILKHTKTGVCRILMRRDKTLKLCANHTITCNMDIKSHSNSEKALVWSTPSDYADGECHAETLCIRFAKPESATEFKTKFEECVKGVRNTSSSLDKESGDKESDNNLANDLSSLTVKEEKDKNDNTKTEGTNASEATTEKNVDK